MSDSCKINLIAIPSLITIAIVFLITIASNARYTVAKSIEVSVDNIVDTPPPINKGRTRTATPVIKDTPVVKATVADSTSRDSTIQTTDTLQLKMSKDSLDAPIDYKAMDSGVLIIPTKEFILYGKANAKYTDVEINAEVINLNSQKNLVTAYGTKDTTGNPLNKPKLVQGDLQTISDTIYYNTRSQKGLTKSTYVQQGEMYVYADVIKKVNNNTAYAWKARFTTCNLDTPHFAFRTRKMKMVSNKIGVSGPASPEFEGVPVPIGIPFGIYPLNRGRHSGLLPPQFVANEQFGLGLEGLGYYQVLNEHFDATLITNIYSYGGWRADLNTKYTKRYKYTGGFNLSIQNTKILNLSGISKQEFTKSRTFLINWAHNRDSKARPGTSFSANVNAGSTKYNQYVANNPVQNFQNNLSSSISFSKDFRGKANLSLNANHSQNNLSRLINLNLPTANFNVVTFYPFQRKEIVGTPKWYEKLGLGYSANLQNQVSFYDSAFSFKHLLDTAQWGIDHTIPITLSLPQIGPLLVSPSIGYEERWYAQQVIRTWDTAKKKVDTTISKGLYTARQMQFGLGFSTRIFGTFQFKGHKGIKAIRHEMRPNISVNYRPDMQKRNFYDVQTDVSGTKQRFSRFDGGVLGPFSEGRFGGIGFGLDNVLEMKVKNNKDTSNGGLKKVKILDGFGFNGSYNLFPSKGDSFPLSPISLYARSTLFEKVNITANATLDPYQVNQYGVRRPYLVMRDNLLNLGRITNGSVAVQTSLTSKSKDGKSDKDRLPKDQFMSADEQQRQLDYVRNNPAEFADFNIPWTINLSYSLNFSKVLQSDYTFKTQTYSNLSAGGDFSLTEKWKLGGNTYYDITTHKIQTLTMWISREMHCWQMSINITPVGLYRSFNITLNPKSGILRDLKINRSRFFYQ